MKLIKQIVVFVITITSVTCTENADQIFNINEQGDISLNKGEYFPREENTDQTLKHDDEFGYKLKTKKYHPPEPKERMQYMIIKRTQEIPATKKYVVAHSSSEMTTYHNKQPSKVAYSVSHKPKPKVMPVKVVQEGSVKHIYLDMPDMFDDEPKSKPSAIPQTYDNVNQAAATNHYQYSSIHPGNYQQNLYGQQVQYSHAPINSASGLNQAGHGFNTVSSGYRIGKANGYPIQGYAQNFHGGYPNTYGSQIYSSSSQYGPQTFDKTAYTTPGASQFVPSFQTQFSHPQFPQFSADGKERFTYEIPEQYKSLFANNAFTTSQFGQQQAFTPNIANNYAYPQQYDLGKTGRMDQVSGFDPDLVNVVNDVLNKGQGYPTPDGFKMIKSSDEKSVYLIGKPGMPLDTVPNLASYTFPTTTQESGQQQVSSKIRFV